MSFSPQQLSDLESIRDVARRCAHALDRLDADAMRATYWPDAYDEHGPSFKGNAWEYVDVAMQSHRDWRASLHTLLNHLIELDGDDAARGEIYVIAYLFDASRPVLYTWLGRYLDRYEKRSDEWRIAERITVSEGSRTDDPIVAMPFPLEQFRPGSFDRPSSGRPIGP